MKPTLSTPRLLAALALGCVSLLSASGQPAGQWDFTSGNLNATVGSPLTYADAASQTGTTFGNTSTLGIPAINGTNAPVMRFGAFTNGQGYRMPAIPASGGGSLVNNYTVIMDVLYPAASDSKRRPLLQTDPGISTGQAAYFQVAANNGIGGFGPGTSSGSGPINGPFDGQIQPNVWYRIGFVNTGSGGVLRKYINGVEVGTQPNAGLDDRFSLDNAATSLLFGVDGTNQAASGYVNSIQIRNTALNSGQMLALGGPSASGVPQTIPTVPSFVQTRDPALNATGVNPSPTVQLVINKGDSVLNTSSVNLRFDNTVVPATVTDNGDNTISVRYAITNLLRPLSRHSLALIYNDSVSGAQSNYWTFTVSGYQSVTLPTPIFLETFDGVAEGSLPPGWAVSNATSRVNAGLDLDNPNSESYENFVVISSNRLATLPGWDGPRRIAHPPIAVNGRLIPGLVSGNLLYGESDVRGASQVQYAFSPDYNLTGRSNIFLAWYSSYEQNQDSMGAVEYSVDGGANWLPVIYFLDDENQTADVIRFPNGTIDAVTTFTTVRGDQALNMAYGAFIGAPVSTNLAPFISGRINDDTIESKRVELRRLPQADNKSTVRLRFAHAGTASWYFGIDNVGFYSINTPVVNQSPLSQSVDEGLPVTFTVVATGNPPLTYQWQFNGDDITGATNSTYTINPVTRANAGLYVAVVANADGPSPSNPAQLTVLTNISIITQPLSEVVDVGRPVELLINARGGRPLSYQWYKDGALMAGTTGATNRFASAQQTNAGRYFVVVTNAYGAITSSVVQIFVLDGPVTNGLVVHLPFDGTLSDTSGRGNSGTFVARGSNAPAGPSYTSGQIGQAFSFTTMRDGSAISYATLGYPTDLQFRDTNNFSISMWLSYTNQIADPPFISNKNWDSSGNRGWGIFAQGGGNFRVNVTGPTGGDRLSTTTTPVIRDGNWHNVVVSFLRGGYAYVYVDGILATKAAFITAGNIDTDDLANFAVNIGQDGRGTYTDGGSSEIVNARIDDLGIWRRPLTALEAAGIYNAGLQAKDLSQATRAVVAVPPTISSHPASRTVTEGLPTSFTVNASGTPPLFYQWRKNGSPIANATNATYSIPSVTSGDVGTYTVAVTNSGGSATSDPAVLTTRVGRATSITGQWDFNEGDLRATIGSPLQYFDAKVQADTQFGTSTSFGIPDVGGAPAKVIKFNPSTPPWGGYIMPHGAAPNGDGTFVNRYTLIYDVLYPAASHNKWRSLLQTSIGNNNDGDLFVNDANGIGISGNYQGTVTFDVWHRIIAVFDLNNRTLTKYLDGVRVGQQTLSSGVDGRFALDTTALLFADEDGETTLGYANSIQFRDGIISDAQAAELGAPGSGGIPGSFTVAARSQGGTNVVLSWSAGSAPYLVQFKASLGESNWVDVVTTSNLTVTIPVVGESGFFRVSGGATGRVDLFTVRLNGAAERPTPVTTPAVGSGFLSLSGNNVTYRISYRDLLSNGAAAHIHGPATENTAAGVMVGLMTPTGRSGVLSGTVTLTDTGRADLTNGMTYVNIHSVDKGGGEIRGQIKAP